MRWFVAAQVGALLIAPQVSAAQGDDPAERLRVLDAVMRFRMEWLGDSTHFDACAAATAVGLEADPRSQEWAGLPLLDRPGAPCEAPRRETSPSRIVLARFVTMHGASAELVAAVRVGLLVHQEEYSLVRTGDAWEVRAAQLSRLGEAVRLLAPGGQASVRDSQDGEHPPVPMTVPELQEPDWFHDESRSVACERYSVGRCLPGVVDIGFHPWASQEQRQDAIDLVGGKIVGGLRAAGTYFIQIPSDGTFESVVRAIEKLRALRQVDLASPHNVTPLTLAVHCGVRPSRLVLHLSACPASPPVPMTVPGVQEPEWLFDPAHRAPCTGLYPGDCLLDVVVLAFHPWATQAQRQDAVDAVDGEVVGGVRATGEYFIRIPADGTLGPVRRAIDALRCLPQVDYAGPKTLSRMTLRSPHSGDRPGSQSWSVTRAPGPARRGSTAVPRLIPQGTTGPAWFLDPSKRVPCTGLMAGTCLRNVVDVDFYPWATQEQRQEAADLIGAEYVSGLRATGTYSFILKDDDGTLGPLARALQLLRALPQVRFAFPHSTEEEQLK